MRTRNYFLFILFYFYAYNINAEVLKFVTYDCDSKKEQVIGSSFAFTEQSLKASYVLTSDHIAVQRENVCYKVLIGDQSLDLELIDNDWATGLALLKFKDKNIKFQSTRDQFYDKLLTRAEIQARTLISQGFPRSSKTIILHKNNAQVLPSDRHQFIGLDKTYEILGLRIENGMSGGVVVSEQGYVLGLITQQIFTSLPGQASVAILSENNSNHGVIIPSYYLKKWTESRLAGEVSSFKTQYQGVNRQMIQSGSLYLMETTVDQQIKLAGGGDGVGVGSESADEKQFKTIAFKLDGKSSIQHEEWQKSYFKGLKPGQVYEVQIGLYINSEANEMKVVKFYSLADFIKSMRSGLVVPIIANGEPVAALAEKKQQDFEVALNLLKSNLLREGVDVAMLDAISALVQLKDSGVNINLSESFVAHIEQNKLWNRCFSIDLDSTVVVLKELKKMSNQKKGLKTFSGSF